MSWDLWDLFFLMGIHDFEIDGKRGRPALLYGYFSSFAMFHMCCKPLANFDTNEVEGSMTRWVDWGDDGEVD
jgi:hypothetical protein